jgi:hypothetical protein
VSGGSSASAASFRDPRGFVFTRDGVVYRQISEAHADDYDRLMNSGLYQALTDEGSLVPHVEVSEDLAFSPGAYKVLRPERVPFVSYPYEWGFAQLRDAALLTLSIQSAAMARDLTLRDGSAFNVTFHRGRPIFLDTTSLGILEEGRPWVAYRQFCQHFVAPLALMAYRDVRLGQLSRVSLEGIPLDLTRELLPGKTRAKAGLMMHVRLHASSQQRHEADESPAAQKPFSRRSFEGLIESLRRTIESLPEAAGASVWRKYYTEAEHYSDEASNRKLQLVDEWIAEVAPETVWDLGANTGRFSRIASGKGIETVAIDSDPFCVDEAYRESLRSGDRHLTAIVSDLTNPSPALGWANEERSSLEERGPADLVLALAVVHHLAIGNNVPLPMVIDYFARIGHRAVIEFIPKTDPKVRQLLRDREDIFADYSEEVFEKSLAERFRVVHREPLADSGRTLYLVVTT